MVRAVSPLVKEAKEDLRVEARPMSGPRTLILRTGSNGCRRGSVVAEGPEMGREGRVHVSVSGFGLGGGPMMPPSRKWIGMDVGGSGGVSGSAWVVGEPVKEVRRCRRERRRGLGDFGVSSCVEKIDAMPRTVFGDIALKSMKMRGSGSELDGAGLRLKCALTASGSRDASSIRCAVATASRGGTIEKMTSEAPKKAASLS